VFCQKLIAPNAPLLSWNLAFACLLPGSCVFSIGFPIGLFFVVFGGLPLGRGRVLCSAIKANETLPRVA